MDATLIYVILLLVAFLLFIVLLRRYAADYFKIIPEEDEEEYDPVLHQAAVTYMQSLWTKRAISAHYVHSLLKWVLNRQVKKRVLDKKRKLKEEAEADKRNQSYE